MIKFFIGLPATIVLKVVEKTSSPGKKVGIKRKISVTGVGLVQDILSSLMFFIPMGTYLIVGMLI